MSAAEEERLARVVLSRIGEPGDPRLTDLGRRVAEGLRLVGPATIQCFDEPDGLPVTDINCRFGGAFPLPLAAGSRYPELALALARGERPAPRLGEFRAGVVMTRFFSDLCLVEDGDGRLCAQGVSEWVLVDAGTLRPHRIPADMLPQFERR